ncbi:MAG: histidine kinase dimerization/phosphoacceptor domain -containing protein, partial [Limnoraphis sp.]
MSNSPPSKPRLSFMQWFYNLPLRRKQILGLVASEVISIVGLVGVGSYLIIHGIREQAYRQAEAELAVTEVNYNIKINQMGFGFRGQSDNSAIIEAAQSYANSRTVDLSLKTQVQQILNNEIRSRQIEYATLVGEDLKIIINGNKTRTGQIFNPHNLVREVLNTPRQIKSSEIITRQELLQESPPNINPKQIENGLIRYTVTPVISPDTQAVIAVLVSGDLINGKTETWNPTLETLEGGYTAIYSIPFPKKTELALSILQQKPQDINSSNPNNQKSNTLIFNQPLLNQDILFDALSTPNQVVTQRLKINNYSYTVAAKTLRNFAGNPVAILVRGTPEILLNQLLKQTLSLQFIISIFALAIDVIIALFLARTISKLMRNLKTASQEFSSGNLQARAEVLSCDEIGELTVMFNQMAEKILKAFEKEQDILQAQSQLNTQLKQQINVRQETEDQLKISLREKEVLLKEIHHRVKNNLFVVANLLEFQSDYFEEPKFIQALEDSKNRVYSMALIHEKLYQST